MAHGMAGCLRVELVSWRHSRRLATKTAKNWRKFGAFERLRPAAGPGLLGTRKKRYHAVAHTKCSLWAVCNYSPLSLPRADDDYGVLGEMVRGRECHSRVRKLASTRLAATRQLSRDQSPPGCRDTKPNTPFYDSATMAVHSPAHRRTSRTAWP